MWYVVCDMWFSRMLLEAIRAGGGRPPSQLPEVFIAPDMHTGGGRGGGGGGEGGVTGVRLGNTLGSGLGALLRGFTLAGGVGGVGGPGGNVGDYAFGDLSQLIQQLMAADTNRVSHTLLWYHSITVLLHGHLYNCPFIATLIVNYSP